MNDLTTRTSFHYAILVGKEVVVTTDMEKWARELESKDRRVAFDAFGNVEISTVFLGINHGWGDKDLWFETMVFKSGSGDFCERYETWQEAEAGHKEIVKVIRKGLKI